MLLHLDPATSGASLAFDQLMSRPGDALVAAIGLYFAASAWLTHRRGPPPGTVEIYAMLFGAAAGVAALDLASRGAGLALAAPAVAAALGAALDLRVIWAGGAGEPALETRRRWRILAAAAVGGMGACTLGVLAAAVSAVLAAVALAWLAARLALRPGAATRTALADRTRPTQIPGMFAPRR